MNSLVTKRQTTRVVDVLQLVLNTMADSWVSYMQPSLAGTVSSSEHNFHNFVGTKNNGRSKKYSPMIQHICATFMS